MRIFGPCIVNRQYLDVGSIIAFGVVTGGFSFLFNNYNRVGYHTSAR